MILKADENITRSGLTLKDTEHSTRPDPRTKQTAYENALHTSDIFINDVVLFLEDNRAEIPLFRRAGNAKNRLSIFTEFKSVREKADVKLQKQVNKSSAELLTILAAFKEKDILNLLKDLQKKESAEVEKCPEYQGEC